MIVEILCLAIVAGLVYFYKFSKLNNFFDDRGIPYVKPIWPFGSNINGLFFRTHPAYNITDIYNKLEPNKLGGFYNGFSPNIIVRDPEYCQRIYSTDFSYFTDRFESIDEKTNPLDGHLFSQKGAKWRYLRHKLSPIFTSGKLKTMFNEMDKCADTYIKHLKGSVPEEKDVDLKEGAAEFTTDVISSCAFGIDANAIGNPDNEFRHIARIAFRRNYSDLPKQILRVLLPGLFMKLKLKTSKPEVENFIMNWIKQSFEYRKSTGHTRNDFIQLLLQLREKGTVDGVEWNKEDKEDQGGTEALKHISNGKVGETFELDDNLMGAQLFVFFIAGFETTASTIYHLIYLFSQNQECQEKARAEIKNAIAKHGTVDYDVLKELTYLESCINETLRLYPPVPFNVRVCTKDYVFPDGTPIPKGTRIILPSYSLHYDPKYYNEPKKFIPDRFTNGATPVKGTHTPFGDGPRICIGKRFALVEIKLAFSKILMNYRLKPSKKHNTGKLHPRAFLLSVADGLYVQVEKISGI